MKRLRQRITFTLIINYGYERSLDELMLFMTPIEPTKVKRRKNENHSIAHSRTQYVLFVMLLNIPRRRCIQLACASSNKNYWKLSHSFKRRRESLFSTWITYLMYSFESQTTHKKVFSFFLSNFFFITAERSLENTCTCAWIRAPDSSTMSFSGFFMFLLRTHLPLVGRSSRHAVSWFWNEFSRV